VDRRSFLKGTLGLAGGAVAARLPGRDLTFSRARPLRLRGERMLDRFQAEIALTSPPSTSRFWEVPRARPGTPTSPGPASGT